MMRLQVVIFLVLVSPSYGGDDVSSTPYTHPIFRYAQPGDQPVRNPEVAPVKVSGAKPKYTNVALRARVEGIVIVEIVIETDGRVSEARVLKPLPFGLDQSAMDAVRTWKFKPGKDHGRPVRTVRNETLFFRLP